MHLCLYVILIFMKVTMHCANMNVLIEWFVCALYADVQYMFAVYILCFVAVASSLSSVVKHIEFLCN